MHATPVEARCAEPGMRLSTRLITLMKSGPSDRGDGRIAALNPS
jgi:hypothetical protein